MWGFEITPESITALRETHRMNQLEFAELLDVHRNTVHYWETGRNRPSGTSRVLLSLFAQPGILTYARQLRDNTATTVADAITAENLATQYRKARSPNNIT